MKVKTWKKSLTLILVLLLSVCALTAKPKSLNRDEIADEYKWNFNDIFSNWDEWQKSLDVLSKKMDEIAGLKGTLGKNSDDLLKVLVLSDELNLLAYKVYRYPQLISDTDTRNQEVAAKLQQVQILFARFGTATSWINPEILTIPWETMEKWLDIKEFAPYRFGMEDLYRQQKHVLDEDMEKLLSFYSQFNSTPRSVYSELSTSDIDFPMVTLSNGDEVKMTGGNYSHTLATNRNQKDRKLAFDSHYKVYEKNKNTYAAIYNSVCQRDWAGAQSRNYKSTLEAALEGNNIPLKVYENLVNTVKANTEPLQRYIKLRKKILGLEKYHSYDGSIALTNFSKEYDYDEATKWVLESVGPLGKTYQKKMNTAISGGWLDVYENDGKRPGAYSADVYGVHPYMLLNFNETLDNVFTLAHELGHTMHTTLANENQPFSTHSYTIFVAEVASTFNERLLLDYLLEKTENPKERIALLQQAIRGITGTFFFQTLLADYELQVHKLVEQGQPVTASILDDIMKDLFTAYYGDTVEEDELLNTVWARIGHFYRAPYYVYQYATCFASSAKLYDDVINCPVFTKKKALKKYLDLLESGGSDYPMNQLKNAGVYLTQPETIIAVIDQLDGLVTQLEDEINKLN